MKFGKTNAERNDKYQSLLAKLYNHRPEMFAILPKQLSDGSWVWWQTIYIDYNVYKNCHRYYRLTNYEGSTYFSYHLEDKE